MQVFTVSQVNTYIKAVLDEIPPVQNIYVGGEISNFKHYTQSGHMYFTLKDASSQLKCVMFSSDNYKLKFMPENGMKVICFGKVGVYERDGVYQLYCRDMQPQGVGSLQLAFEQMRDKLEREGLFDDAHKKPIPRFPKKIGVATSNMGAAIEDIKNIISRRYPLCEIVIMPTVVQGDLATDDIVRSIKALDTLGDIDVIIVGRGGGSLEDLWAFNTEPVARAVYECKTPIISAVGHETDYTICDLVSDLRAPTPSAAAEQAVPDIINLNDTVNNLSVSIDKAFNFLIENAEKRLLSISTEGVLSNKIEFIDSLITKIDNLNDKMKMAASHNLENKDNLLSKNAYSLNALSPLAVLGRGYSLAYKNNALVCDANSIMVDDKLSIKFSNGVANTVVTEVKINE